MYQIYAEQYFLPLLIALLGFNLCYGQEAKVLKVPRSFRIDFENPNYRLKVIDARTDTLHIGYSWTDPSHPPKRFRLHAPLAHVLQERIVHPNVRSEVPVLYLKILKFELSYIKTTRLVSRCEIVLDFIEERLGKYVLIDQKSIIISGYDADKRAILEGFQELISDFNQSDNRLNIPVSRSELWSPIQYAAQRYAIENDIVKSGVYSTFLEFRNNTPKNSQGLIIDWHEKSDSNRVRVKIRKAYNKGVVHDIWGFSENNESYVQIGNHYFHLRPSTNRDSFDFQLNVVDRNDNAIFLGTVLFGLAGGALAGAVSKSVGYQRLKLDLITGEFSQLEDYDSTFIDSTIVTLLRNNKSKSAKPMKVFVGGQMIGEFAVGRAILSVNVPTLYQDLAIQVLDFNGSSELILEDISGGDRFVFIDEKKGFNDLRSLEREQAQYHFGMIKNFEKKKLK